MVKVAGMPGTRDVVRQTPELAVVVGEELPLDVAGELFEPVRWR